MKRNRLTIFALALACSLAWSAVGQKQKTPKVFKQVKSEPAKVSPSGDVAADEKKVRDMIDYLGFVFNTLGNHSTSSRDKDVLITQSYSKIFRDEKVQIEDDLDEERRVVTNKDVVAYLKDIDFFFKEVKFDFTIDKIEHGVNTSDLVFYKVSLQRNLTGTTSDGKAVTNHIPRFIEVNLNPKDQDLKIVSIYTHEISEKDALKNWWNSLSYEWQTIFRQKFKFGDSLALGDIRKITALAELDLSHNRMIQSVEPLSALTGLKNLDLSYTQVNDLTPIRNLAGLLELSLSHTPVRDLGPLKYFSTLQHLDVSNTKVSDITVAQRMPDLQYLNMTGTAVTDFTPLAGLAELVNLNLKQTGLSDLTPLASLKGVTELNVAKTLVTDFNPITEWKSLKTLVCDSTRVQSTSALAGLESLTVLHANHTLITDLRPLQKLTHLEKVYCDQTQIKKNEAEMLTKVRPNVLVVYDSRDMKAWWDALSPAWREVISKHGKISHDPQKEELATLGNVDSISISGNIEIRDLEPLRKFQKLKVLIANHTGIVDLAPITDCKEINYLNVSETRVTDLLPAVSLTKLKELRADKCQGVSIDPLQKMKHLEKLYVDETGVNDINAHEFLEANPDCLLIYKTVHLRRWWQNLSGNWRDVFLSQLKKDTTRENLHRLVEQEAFHFKDAPVTDLSGMSEFMRLKDLHFSGTAIVNIKIGENIKSLRSLHASSGPIHTVESLNSLIDLEDLDISNTPIDDITGLWELKNLKSLNCAGTQVKRLDVLENMEKLEVLDCSNTNVTKLTALDYLPLKVLRCYNTKVSARSIENFSASHPDCKVIFYK